ncbi:MAG: DUF2160 domain-containing protein [Proteobacteria bacterium]|nr:DUF2160 domain-containing protein [Pseudomonadota bacterium]
MSWMAWTLATGIFFACIFTVLVVMAVWEQISPTVERRGFLPMATTRGDRLFIGLLCTAFIYLFWLATTDASPWLALPGSLIWMAAIGRWG